MTNKKSKIMKKKKIFYLYYLVRFSRLYIYQNIYWKYLYFYFMLLTNNQKNYTFFFNYYLSYFYKLKFFFFINQVLKKIQKPKKYLIEVNFIRSFSYVTRIGFFNNLITVIV